MSKSNKMISCKTCSAEIAASAKVCPHCGAKNKKSNSVLIGILVFFIFIIIIGASGGEDEPKKVDGNIDTEVSSQTGVSENKNNEAEKEEKKVFSVGETAELHGVTVTLVNVTISEGSGFNRPTEGNVFVICEFEIANNSDREITVSTMMSFEAYCDDYTCTFSLGALMEKENKNQLDGTVAPGKKFNGVVGYEVPVDWKELEVVFTPDFWRGTEITFVATND